MRRRARLELAGATQLQVALDSGESRAEPTVGQRAYHPAGEVAADQVVVECGQVAVAQVAAELVQVAATAGTSPLAW